MMLHHVKNHSKKLVKHLKKHHKKYLFGIIGGGIFLKLATLIFTSLGISLSLITNAEMQSGCYLTGQYLTGGYITGGYYTGGYYTGGYLTGCYLTGGYFTGGYLSGDEMVDQYWTGEYETGCYLTGEYLTGQEFTGWYWTGQYLTGGYWTGCSESDTIKPTITGIVVSLNGVVNNYIGLNGIAKISFIASEELTGNIVTFRGNQSELVSKSGLQYVYQQILSTANAEGPLGFSVLYKDLAGNTGFYTATGPIIFDRTAPIITGFSLSGDDQNGFFLSWLTNENTKYVLNYSITGGTGNSITGTTYGTSFVYGIHGMGIGKICDFQVKVFDYVGNTSVLTGKIEIGNNGVVNFTYTIGESTLASMNTGMVTYIGETGTQLLTKNFSNFAITLQNEINKFNQCKDSIAYKEINLLIQGNDFTLQMPQFEKETVKKLVQAFTVYMVAMLKKEIHLTVEDLHILTKRFNNVLIILKLVRDDENECKQSLSNYHIMQFKNTLKEYGIEIE